MQLIQKALTSRRSGPQRLVMFEIAKYLFGFRTTRAGLYLGVGWMLCGSIGSFSVDMPIFRLFFVLAAVMGVAFVAGPLLRPRLTVTGGLPARASAGQPLRGEFMVTNASRRAGYEISVGYFGLPRFLRSRAEEARIVERLAPGESARVDLEIVPLRRGLYPLPPLRAYSTFPFGMWRCGPKVRSGGSLLVLPEFHALDDVDVPVGSRYQPGGLALTSNVGESPEYIGNREYRPGDPWRRVDFRSWARLAKPVVREYQEEYYHRVALVLDTFVPGRRRGPATGFPQLEAAVSLSAAVADGLSRGEYIIDLFAAGPELYVFRSGRHVAHFDNVLEILACVDACRRNPFETVTPALADELGTISTVICVLLDWDAARRDLVRAAAEAGCRVKVVVVRDGATSEPIAGAETDDISVYSPEAIRHGEVDAV